MSQQLLEKPQHIQCNQKISEDGKIIVKKRGWILRIAALAGLIAVIEYNLLEGIRISSPLIVYATLMPLHSFIVLIVGWIFYRNPAINGIAKNDLVSVIIPVFNQEAMISHVIDAIYNSTYKNIQVVAVNDGSKDNTKKILDELAKKYPSLKVIHKKNEGKRLAVATGFYNSTGEYVILIDSDSVVDKKAIQQLKR